MLIQYDTPYYRPPPESNSFIPRRAARRFCLVGVGIQLCPAC